MKTEVKMLFITIFVLLISSPSYLDVFVKAIGYAWVFVCFLDCLCWSIHKLRDKIGKG